MNTINHRSHQQPFQGFWAYFLVFLLSNILLSYGTLPLEVQIGTGFLGIVFPFVLAHRNRLSSGSVGKPLFSTEFLTEIPFWTWFSFFMVVLFLRFFRLTTLSCWPHYDEGIQNFEAFLLSRQWEWRLFFSYSQITPAYLWISALWLKLSGPSLFNLWLMPAVLSSLTVPMAYLAARQFFSKSFSFLCVLLMGLSFWPLFIGRFSFIPAMLLFWECLFFFIWGRWKSSQNTPRERGWLFVAGIFLGFGFYIQIPTWTLFSTLCGGSVFFLFLHRPKNQWKKMYFLIVPIVLLMAPLALAAYRTGYGLYLRDLSGVQVGQGFSERLSIFASYLSAIFWGPGAEFSAYQSVWGGFLNPLWGSLFSWVFWRRPFPWG